MILLLVFIFLCLTVVALLVAYAIKNVRNSRFAVSSTAGLCDAESKLNRWEIDNPYGSKYDPEFQDLFRAYIGAYMIWMLYHPYRYDDGYLDRLEKYLV